MKRVLHLKGMHGLGDSIHQRWPIRHLMTQFDEVRLETPWHSVYWDLVDQGLKVIGRQSHLRTQQKNFDRERTLFVVEGDLNNDDASITHNEVWFRAQHIREEGSVLGAMCKKLDVPLGNADFTLPCKNEWFDLLDDALNKGGYKNDQEKPIMIYRPLNNRIEWGGCMARNPLPHVYAELYESIRNDFYVISIADFEDGREWCVDARDASPDLKFHKGELSFEQLAALFTVADMTFCSPGFSVILSQAVNTPVACVFGGYENSKSFSAGARWAPYLGIDPINPCQCFLHSHPCRKEIDTPLAIQRLQRFARDAVTACIAARV